MRIMEPAAQTRLSHREKTRFVRAMTTGNKEPSEAVCDKWKTATSKNNKRNGEMYIREDIYCTICIYSVKGNVFRQVIILHHSDSKSTFVGFSATMLLSQCITHLNCITLVLTIYL